MALIKGIINIKDFIPGDTGLGVNYYIALAERDWRQVTDFPDPFLYIFPNDDSVKIEELWKAVAENASENINNSLRNNGYALLATCSPKDLYVYGLSDPKGRPEAKSRPLPARGGKLEQIPTAAGGVSSIPQLETTLSMVGNETNILHAEVEFQTEPISAQITYCLELHTGFADLVNPVGINHIPLSSVKTGPPYVVWGEKDARQLDESLRALDSIQAVVSVHRTSGSGVIPAAQAGVPRGLNVSWITRTEWTPSNLPQDPQHWYRGDSLSVPERITTMHGTKPKWKDQQLVNAWRNLVNTEVVPGIPRQQPVTNAHAAIQNEPRWAPVIYFDGINGLPALEWGTYFDGWPYNKPNMWKVDPGQLTEMRLAAVYSGQQTIMAVQDYNGSPRLAGAELLTDGTGETILGRNYRGRIAEVIIGNMSTENKQKVEGYLAHKYGIILDVAHPYHDLAPTV